LKVAAVLGEFPKLSERFIARELAELTRQGMDLHVFSLEKGDPELLEEEPFASCARRHSYLPHPRRWIESHLVGAPVRTARYVLETLRSLPADPRRTIAFALRNGWCSHLVEGMAQAEDALGTKFDLVWGLWASLPGAVAMVAADVMDLPFAVSCHAWDVFVNRALVRAQLRDAAAVTACTGAAANHLRNLYGADADKVRVVRHGVRIPDSPPPPRVPPPDRPLRVVGLGRLVPKKGFRYLVSAAAAGGDFEVELVGEGPELDALRKLAAGTGATERVHFTGPANAAGLEAAFARCDAICAPSVVASDGDRDGVPNCLLEASLAGLPVIASDAGGLPEFAEDGRSALVFPAGDPAAIAESVRRLAAEEGLAARLVAGARELLRERFDLEKNAGELAGVLRAAAG
jgi:glycosyltransferase involved in cell wall biosynthesis